MIEHSNALSIFESHFQCLEKQPIDAKIGDKPLFVRPLTCKQWHDLLKLKGMDYNIRLLLMAVVYEDGSPLFNEADLFRIESRVDGAVIAALANMACEAVVSGVNDLKNGLRRPEANS